MFLILTFIRYAKSQKIGKQGSCKVVTKTIKYFSSGIEMTFIEMTFIEMTFIADFG
jgi:hypothetical protein